MQQHLSLKVTLTSPGTTINYSAVYLKEYSALGLFPKLIVVGRVEKKADKSELDGFLDVVELNFEILVEETGYKRELPVIFYLLNSENYPVYHYPYKKHPGEGDEPEWYDLRDEKGMKELEDLSPITKIKILKIIYFQSTPMADLLPSLPPTPPPRTSISGVFGASSKKQNESLSSENEEMVFSKSP